MEKLTLSPPWEIYASELEALFGSDPEIKIVREENGAHVVKLYVANTDKANALTVLLPEEVTFGNVTMQIIVVPPNTTNNDIADLFKAAFNGNPAFCEMLTFETPITGKVNYAVFAGELVQFFNDDLRSPYGIETTIYEDIAREVFADVEGVNFCTERVIN